MARAVRRRRRSAAYSTPIANSRQHRGEEDDPHIPDEGEALIDATAVTVPKISVDYRPW